MESSIPVDGTSYTLAVPYPDGVMWDEPGKACKCKMFGFRALQAVGDHLGLNDTFTRNGTVVKTGWNTHGAEELYVDTFNWTGGGDFSYAAPITAAPYLTLADAWYEFTDHTGRLAREGLLPERGKAPVHRASRWRDAL